MLLVPSLVLAANNQATIPSGTFMMGCSVNDKDCENDEINAKVFIKAFSIDKTEVTVAQYKQCVAIGQCKKPLDNQRNQYCNYGAKDRSNHPVNCIDWQDALNYCQSQGKRLPYEAEWEKAARGKTTSRYPWGRTATCQHAILDDGITKGSAANELDGCGEDRTWPVATKAPNAYGLYDMHGNVGEWTMNWYAKNAVKQFYVHGQLDKPETGRQKIIRGGSWDEIALNLRSSFRNVKPPKQDGSIYGSIGFRCVTEH